MTRAKAAALGESDKEAVESLLLRLFADGNKAISGFFCGSVRRAIRKRQMLCVFLQRIPIGFLKI